MPIMCKVCSLAVEEGQLGRCKLCMAECHIGCMTGRTRDSTTCKTCELKLLQRPKEGDQGKGERFSLEIPFSSTMIRETDRTSSLAKENEELHRRLEKLEELIRGALPSTQLPPNNQSDVNNASQSNVESEVSANNASATTMNRTQQVIFDSIKVEPLTKQELECRKHVCPLPVFDGTPTKWFRFVSSERDSTAKCGFSPVERMDRISAALTGPARALVGHLLDRPHRVDRAMELLEKRYGGPEALLAYTTALVRDMRPLIRGNSGFSNLSQFYGDVMNVQEALECMEESAAFTPLVETIIRTKIPQDTGREWLAHRGQRKSTIGLLGEFIEKLMDDVHELQEYEFDRAARPSTQAGKALRKPVLVATCHPGVASGSSEARLSTTTTGPQGSSCVVCSATGHSLPSCPQFLQMTVSERWNQVKAKRRCTACLGRHFLRQCNKKKPCPYRPCSYFHHALLHDETTAQAQVEVHRALVASRGGSSHHQVVEVVVEANGLSRSTYALLDPGSSVSMISKDLARELHLSGNPTTMHVAWMNNQSHNINTEQLIVKLKGVTRRSDEKVDGFEVTVHSNHELLLPRHRVTREFLESRKHGNSFWGPTKETGLQDSLSTTTIRRKRVVELEEKWRDRVLGNQSDSADWLFPCWSIIVSSRSGNRCISHSPFKGE